jgi:hypothetical protein
MGTMTANRVVENDKGLSSRMRSSAAAIFGVNFHPASGMGT